MSNEHHGTIAAIIEEVCNADERRAFEASIIDYGGTPTFPTIEDILAARNEIVNLPAMIEFWQADPCPRCGHYVSGEAYFIPATGVVYHASCFTAESVQP